MEGSPSFTMISLGLLLGRQVLGLAMAAHGAQKLFGWFGGHGLAGTGGYFESVGFRPGRPLATVAGLSEFTGGLLIALGFLGPVGPALMVAVMIVALTQHAGNGFFAMNNGIEVPLLYLAGGLVLTVTGFGRYSLDAALGLGELHSPEVATTALAVAVVGGLSAIALRRTGADARTG
jgi:putative oxidoreductase